MAPSAEFAKCARRCAGRLLEFSLGRLQRYVQALSMTSSKDYWIRRYQSGGDSGQGSKGQLARFKAEVVNKFVEAEKITSIIEFGCGDGTQLLLAQYPDYLGFDISPDAIARCERLFRDDPRKRFKLVQDYAGEKAELILSLDVIYHLVEDDVFAEHMRMLFNASEKFVIIYSSNTDRNSPLQGRHIRHRHFTAWIDENIKGWKLRCKIPNKYPKRWFSRSGSHSEFFIYERAATGHDGNEGDPRKLPE
jgi:SAM-dependent methyltransferase